jgi:hypothetical protein
LPFVTDPPFTQRAQRRRRTFRRRTGAVALLILTVAVGASVWVAERGRGDAPAPPRSARAAPAAIRKARAAVLVRRLVPRSVRSLDTPLQDAAVAAAGTRVLLLGGLNAADTSTGGVRTVSGGRARTIGEMPTVFHDGAAVGIGRAVYEFGGGDGVRQLESIVRVDPASGATANVGRLPSPSSDQAAAEIAGTAYVVGGYTGSRWLDTIVAWRPGRAAHVVAQLPSPLRYAAVTAGARKILIAGGSLPNGSASDLVLEYVPATGRVMRVGRLPAATTHAAAATLGDVAYVIGGRGAAIGSPVRRIVAVELGSGRIRPAGRLSTARSDLAAVAVGARIVVIGGRGPNGTTSAISELVPRAK